MASSVKQIMEAANARGAADHNDASKGRFPIPSRSAIVPGLRKKTILHELNLGHMHQGAIAPLFFA